MDTQELDSALRALVDEQQRLENARSDYARITRSRFHALRMLWFSLKAFLGFDSTRDIYAVASPGVSAPPRSVATASGLLEAPPAPRPLQAPAAPAGPEADLITAWTARTSASPPSQTPVVTIIIPVYDHVDVTIRCLHSIATSWFETLKVQIVVVDDASPDRSTAIVAHLPGIDYLRNGANLGFLRSCNRGAQIARGKYLCFLNNDTTVSAGWLDHLVTRAESDEKIGAVGAKLIYPDGKLQEAGGIIWNDATGWNYGRGEDPADSRYNYVRDVDYCSGAALLVRTALFEQLGGFDERFVPAYYEDADLCFAIRALGYRVVYEPRAEVTHYEGVSSGTSLDSGVKRHQQLNLPKFRNKWNAELRAHPAPDARNVARGARRLGRQRVVLVVDSYVPMQDKDAGSLRLLRLIKMMRDLHYDVKFLPDNYACLQPYTACLQAMGVEVLHHIDGGRDMKTALAEVLPLVDIAWICRPQLFEKYAPMIRARPDIRVIYDTIDLHFLRGKREAELLGSKNQDWKKLETLETNCAKSADATVVVSLDEKQLLESYGVTRVSVIPTIHDLECTDVPGFESRAGILFIGGYNHTPNVDAVKWLCLEIMPLVWAKLPEVRVTLLGSNPPADVLALAGENVRVTGYVPDVTSFFMKSRVFVAPMRFGAGLKGKVGHSLAFGLPVVTTEIGSEGFDLQNERDALVAQGKEAFAAATVRLYSDRALWESISAGSAKVVARFSSAAVAPALGRLLEELVAPPVGAQA